MKQQVPVGSMQLLPSSTGDDGADVSIAAHPRHLLMLPELPAPLLAYDDDMGATALATWTGDEGNALERMEHILCGDVSSALALPGEVPGIHLALTTNKTLLNESLDTLKEQGPELMGGHYPTSVAVSKSADTIADELFEHFAHNI